MKYFFDWTGKIQKNVINGLSVINLLIIPLTFPVIAAFSAYLKGKEIFYNDVVFGTFRRYLSENEKKNLYQTTVQNFLEKSEVSKEILEKLNKFAHEKTKDFMIEYINGSDPATKYICKRLEIQKEFLQREELRIKNLALETVSTNQQTNLSWIYEKTIDGINVFNPWVAKPWDCATAWLLVAAALYLTYLGLRTQKWMVNIEKNQIILNQKNNNVETRVTRVETTVDTVQDTCDARSIENDRQFQQQDQNIYQLGNNQANNQTIQNQRAEFTDTKVNIVETKVDTLKATCDDRSIENNRQFQQQDQRADFNEQKINYVDTKVDTVQVTCDNRSIENGRQFQQQETANIRFDATMNQHTSALKKTKSPEFTLEKKEEFMKHMAEQCENKGKEELNLTEIFNACWDFFSG